MRQGWAVLAGIQVAGEDRGLGADQFGCADASGRIRRLPITAQPPLDGHQRFAGFVAVVDMLAVELLSEAVQGGRVGRLRVLEI